MFLSHLVSKSRKIENFYSRRLFIFAFDRLFYIILYKRTLTYDY